MERLTDERAVIKPGTYLVSDDLLDDVPEIRNVSKKELYYRLGLIENALGKNYDLGHLRELIESDRGGRCAVLPVKPAHEVWIVERDEDGEPECVTGYVFLAQVKDHVIVARFLNGSGDVDEILKDQAVQTLIEYNGDLPVFLACDCYLDKESALKAMKERENDD